MDRYNGDDGRPLTMDELEEGAIRNALRHASGNVSTACAVLGICRSTIYRKFRRYGIDVPCHRNGRDEPAPAPTATTTKTAIVEIVEVAESAPTRLPPGTFGSPEANRALAEMLKREGLGRAIQIRTAIDGAA